MNDQKTIIGKYLRMAVKYPESVDLITDLLYEDLTSTKIGTLAGCEVRETQMWTPPPKRTYHMLTDDEIREILILSDSGRTDAQIAQDLGKTHATINNVTKGKDRKKTKYNK